MVASTAHFVIDILLDLLYPLSHLLVLLILGLPHELLSYGLHLLLNQLLYKIDNSLKEQDLPCRSKFTKGRWEDIA